MGAVRRGYVAARRWLSGLVFERRHHLQTEAEIGLAELGLAGEGRGRYKPAGWLTLRRILPVREVGEEDVFVDYGSGMGRVVYQAAARYPFKRVIGVELSEELNAIAQENIDRNRPRLRCQDVELLTSDALGFEVPPDVSIAFFNNPFTGDLFASVIDRLLASYDRHPRPLRIIYCNPREHDLLLATGRVRPLRRVRGWRPGRQWSRSNSTRMYEVTAAGR